MSPQRLFETCTICGRLVLTRSRFWNKTLAEACPHSPPPLSIGQYTTRSPTFSFSPYASPFVPGQKEHVIAREQDLGEDKEPTAQAEIEENEGKVEEEEWKTVTSKGPSKKRSLLLSRNFVSTNRFAVLGLWQSTVEGNELLGVESTERKEGLQDQESEEPRGHIQSHSNRRRRIMRKGRSFNQRWTLTEVIYTIVYYTVWILITISPWISVIQQITLLFPPSS